MLWRLACRSRLKNGETRVRGRPDGARLPLPLSRAVRSSVDLFPFGRSPSLRHIVTPPVTVLRPAVTVWTLTLRTSAILRKPSSLRSLICPLATKLKSSTSAASSPGREPCVFTRRRNSSFRRSITLVVRIVFHWLFG